MGIAASVLGLSIVAAACGSGGGAPDVTGGPASTSATLFKASNLSNVLDKVKGELGTPQVTTVKIEPRDVKAIGTTKVVTLDYNNKSLAVNTPSIPGQPAFDINAINPANIEKAVMATESKAGVNQTDIAYVTVTGDPTNNNTPSLGVYVRNSADHYLADINGGNVTKGGSGGGTSIATPPSGGATTASSIPTPPSGATSGTSVGAGGGGSGAGSLADCVARAGTDLAKIKACTGQ